MFVVRNPSRNSMPMLRTTFKTGAKAIDGARLYVTARGIYEVFLNGKRVGDDYYNPGLTQYNITHMYQTYDVTGMLKAGDNAMGAMLGEGWWSGLLSFGNIWNHFGDRQSLLAKLVITYKDGTSETVTTNDRTWKYYGNGPVVYSSLDFGEVYDAARETRGRRAGPRPPTTTARGSPRSSCRSRARRSPGRTAAGAEARRGRRSRSTSCRSSARSATTPASSAR